MTEGTVQEVGPKPVPPSPFREENWTETPGSVQPAPVEEQVPANDPPPNDPPPAEPPVEPVFDYNKWVKENFGFDDVDSAKAQLAELRELKIKQPESSPAEIKFANEQSENLFKALQEGKKEDVFKYLNDEHTLSRVSGLEVSDKKAAEEVIKTHLQYTHKDLTSEEINDLYEEKFGLPKKPVQALDETDEDYQEVLKEWQTKVEKLDRKIIREAKLAKPELSKLHSELVLPDISKTPAPVEQQPTPEELEGLRVKAEAAKSSFFKDVDTGLNSFNGFNVTFKDEAVELPVAYNPSAEERASVKQIAESLYSDFSYFGQRWGNEDGSWNTAKMVADLHLLENAPKILQKFANESATKRMEEHLKIQHNIDLNTGKNTPAPTGTFAPNNKEAERAGIRALFQA